VNNLRSFIKEPFSPYFADLYPRLEIASDQIKYGPYKGKIDSWESIGHWRNALNEGRQTIPEETIGKLKVLTKDCSDDKERAKLLYEYLQNEMRYVSIQEGIGGLQPFTAEYVDKNKFGDCKALSNFMMSMLKVFDIPSYYTVVYAGPQYRKVDTEFPTSVSNHVILTVPFEQDTVFLECTSKDAPFGYVGDFTEDRYALMVKPEGGELVYIPAYTYDQNKKTSSIDIQLNEEGNAQVAIKAVYEGLEYEDVSGMLKKEKKDQEEVLLDFFNWGNIRFTDFSYTEKRDRMPEITEEIDFTADNYASITGTRMFIPVNKISNFSYVPKKVETRNYPIRKSSKYTHVDTVKLSIPEGYKVEHLPSAKSIETEFGSYSYELEQVDKSILYKRKLVQKDGVFPKESYNELVKFYKEIVRGDKKRIVLVKEKS
jgi:hypothetical protein